MKQTKTTQQYKQETGEEKSVWDLGMWAKSYHKQGLGNVGKVLP